MFYIAHNASYAYCFFILFTNRVWFSSLFIPNSDVFQANTCLICHHQRVELAHPICLPLNGNSSHSLIRNSAGDLNISLISTLDSY